jgi:hypothetical protein
LIMSRHYEKDKHYSSMIYWHLQYWPIMIILCID